MSPTKGAEMANHDVFLLEAGGEFWVRPSVTIVPRGKLKLRNLTKYDALVVFPNNLLDPAQPLGQSMKAKGSKDPATGKKTDELEPTLHAASDGDYDYQVVVIKDGTAVVARGDSWPKIIVDP